MTHRQTQTANYCQVLTPALLTWSEMMVLTLSPSKEFRSRTKPTRQPQSMTRETRRRITPEYFVKMLIFHETY